MSLRRLSSVAGVLLLLGPLILGTEPLPPPYHEFLQAGYVDRPFGGSKQHFIVSLVGRFPYYYPDSTIELAAGLALSSSNAAVSVTDTAGFFRIDVKCPVKPDSLAIQVSAVDKPVLRGPFFPVPEASMTITGEYQDPHSGCSGCNTNEPMQTYVKGYRYQLPIQRIALPY